MLPNYRHFISATLLALSSESHPLKRRDVVESAATIFGVTDEQRRETLPSGTLRYVSRVGFALTALKMSAFAENSGRGIWTATTNGRDLFRKYPNGLSESTVAEIFKHSQSYQRSSGVEKSSEETPESSDSIFPPDPEMVAREAIRKNNVEVVDKLIKLMWELTPEQFELVALNILRQAGYGHESIEPVHTGQSGDGGIDGWLPLDRLGLQRVFVQAKRYKEGNNVSSSSIRDFVGAMLQKGARIGVFVTLSDFTRDAFDTAEKISDRTVHLLNGKKLATMMIDIKAGVSHESLPPFAKVDSDFFDEL